MESNFDRKNKGLLRRRTFLIDRKFQLKYTFIIVIIGVVVSAVLGSFIYRLTTVTSDMATMEAAIVVENPEPNKDAEFLKRTRQEIREGFDQKVLFSLSGFVAVMAIFLFVWGIFVTHRVAGPIYLISGYLKSLSEGKVPKTRPLRKGDQLKNFFDTFVQALEKQKHRNLDEAVFLDECARTIRDKGDQELIEIARKIQELSQRKKSWEEFPDA